MYSMYLVPAFFHVYFRKPTWRRAFGPSDPWGLNCPTPTWVSPLENERLVHLRKSPTNRKRTSSSIFHVHSISRVLFFLSHGSEKNGDCEPICCYLLLKSVLFHFKFLKLPSSFCKLFLTSKAEKKTALQIHVQIQRGLHAWDLFFGLSCMHLF